MGNTAVGFICAGVAAVCFGSNFVPVKQFETGNGIFFQFILCVSIWCVGVIVNIIRDFPDFEPIAMTGGVLWCTGNLMVVPVIKTIGLGMGVLIWGLVNLMMGWASGNFGWFGLEKETEKTAWLNYLGFAIACCALFVYAFIKPTIKNIGTIELAETSDDEEKAIKTPNGGRRKGINVDYKPEPAENSYVFSSEDSDVGTIEQYAVDKKDDEDFVPLLDNTYPFHSFISSSPSYLSFFI